MLRGSEKKEALTSLDRSRQYYESQVKATQTEVENLHLLREKCSRVLTARIEAWFDDLTNRPNSCNRAWEQLKQEVSVFDNTVEKFEAEHRSTDADTSITGTSLATGAGVATGAGMAVFGSTAGMAVATTFGTASSGAAISSLGGAAATNAALAWLGGGTLAAGGGGIAAGKALLALMGPIGVSIGVLSLAGGAITTRKRNGKIIEETQVEELHIQELTGKLNTLKCEVLGISSRISKHYQGVESIINTLGKTAPTDVQSFDANQQERLDTLITHLCELSQLINKKIQ